MPGSVIQGHAKYEDDCRRCHIPFRKSAQDGLCLDCHKGVAADARSGQGYHGRLQPQQCRACHTEHKGREARIVQLDERAFDHRQTDFALRGAHARPGVACRSCHAPGAKHRDAPARCADCHAKDDAHRGRLGPACADCHVEEAWRQVRFDHAQTRFPLRARHAPVKCDACHANARYRETPTDCNACHAGDDRHRGRFGPKCETCHTDEGWPSLVFDHDRDTRYPLRDAHRRAACVGCHTGQLYRDKLQTDCVACHRKDDRHKGTLGARCGECHVERGWKATRFDHARTRFPLGGRHAAIECGACHRGPAPRETPRACIGCHRADDTHRGTLGEACADCHGEQAWTPSRFQHSRTRFPLLGKHLTTQCRDCHRTADYRAAPTECHACHRKDDAHAGQQGADCGACHSAMTWRDAKFDHGRSRFPLVGRHAGLGCRQCHATSRFKDARAECAACHLKDDVHAGRLGTLCHACHNARDWKLWDFSHARMTRFVLDGAHAKLACAACHRQPVAGSAALPTTCVSCHAADDRHDGALGPRCERCHVTASFRRVKAVVGDAAAARAAGIAPTGGDARYARADIQRAHPAAVPARTGGLP